MREIVCEYCSCQLCCSVVRYWDCKKGLLFFLSVRMRVFSYVFLSCCCNCILFHIVRICVSFDRPEHVKLLCYICELPTLSTWICICCFRFDDVTNSLWHVSHVWGFSPLWTLSCLFRFDTFYQGWWQKMTRENYLSKCLTTSLTNVRLFSIMCSFMLLQRGILSEGFIARCKSAKKDASMEHSGKFFYQL